jgi:hypothetical protein
MIRLMQIAQELDLEILAGKALSRPVAGGYAGDLLSSVMAKAGPDFIWVTLQSHVNVVAVASMAQLAGVIITEGNRPDAETLERAEQEGTVLMSTRQTTFTVVAALASLGVRGPRPDHSRKDTRRQNP